MIDFLEYLLFHNNRLHYKHYCFGAFLGRLNVIYRGIMLRLLVLLDHEGIKI